jgi:dihydroxyacid dehydratase/phosphogluconate dehydratase
MAISDTIKHGVIRAPHRSLLRATGMVKSQADFNPYSEKGGPAVLFGNFAPNGSV